MYFTAILVVVNTSISQNASQEEEKWEEEEGKEEWQEVSCSISRRAVE